jgi:hypothetical protein
MNVQNSGVAVLRDRAEKARLKGQTVPFEEKLELMIFGRSFSAAEWNKEWSEEELKALWTRRDGSTLAQVASLAEAHSRMRDAASKENEKTRDDVWNLTKVLLPDIWDVAQKKISANELTESEVKEFTISRLIWEFSSESDPNAGTSELKEARIRVAQEALWELLAILPLCRLTDHGLQAGVLCLSRRAIWEASDLTRVAPMSIPANIDLHGGKWVEHQRENRPGQVTLEYQPEGNNGQDLKGIFQRFERYTVQNILTSDEISKILCQNGLPHDPAGIRRASAYLGVRLKEGTRGQRANVRRPKKKTRVRQKRGVK